MAKKPVITAAEAAKMIPDGATILCNIFLKNFLFFFVGGAARGKMYKKENLTDPLPFHLRSRASKKPYWLQPFQFLLPSIQGH